MAGGRQRQDQGKARSKVVAQRGVHLDRIFGKDDGDRPLGKNCQTLGQKLVERDEMHGNPQV